eukprot:NODE_27_length_33950_cov_0.349739.p3 type:complete len:920 gc:universal NODE_27_length_33950_cov_0.349739:12698-9939(-)
MILLVFKFVLIFLKSLRHMSRWDRARNTENIQPAQVKRKSRWDIQDNSPPQLVGNDVDYVLAHIDSILPSQGYAIVYNQLTFSAPVVDLQEEQLTKPYLQLFPLLKQPDEVLSTAELKQKKVAYHLLHLVKGQQYQRKTASRHLEFADLDLVMKNLLTLMIQEQLSDSERLAILKLIDKMMIKHGDKLRLYVNELLVIILPLLVSEDYMTRRFGFQLFGNLTKAVGAFILLNRLKQDTANEDEFMRQCCSKALSVILSTVGISSVMPFVKAICASENPDERHTGVRTLYFSAQRLGISLLPQLGYFIDALKDRLDDKNIQVRTITFLAISALAESCHPYGIEKFEPIVLNLWKNVKQHRGKALVAALKAVGCIIPLMDTEDASYYTRQIIPLLVREFGSFDADVKRTILLVLCKCCQSEIKMEPTILNPFLESFWNRRMALDRRMVKPIIDATVALASKLKSSEILSHLKFNLKDESEPLRKMSCECLLKLIEIQSVDELDLRLQQEIVDGLLYAFQHQSMDEPVTLNAFSTFLEHLRLNAKPYIEQIMSTILFRLNSKTPKVRQLTAELISKITMVLKDCNELKQLNNLGVVLYEYLGEEYPDTLASIIAGLNSVVVAIGMDTMTPPIKDLLPRLTPILRNRHEQVQENCISLVGYIAEHGADHINPREWIRISFELVELMRAQRKGIRKASTVCLGCIAQAIGPQEVLATLINNLKVQERQIRLCTAVSIGIIAQKCGAYTILAQLLNEYRYPEVNVQNGVLKSISYIFEYIGPDAIDYTNVATTLIEDALVDRDVIHRQIGCQIIKNLASNVYGCGLDEQLIHMLNLTWPNLFESSHVLESVFEAIEALSLSLGSGLILQYLLQGLFHPARRVRQVYWKIYNGIYISGQDSMVPYYPKIENEDKQLYYMHVMDYLL